METGNSERLAKDNNCILGNWSLRSPPKSSVLEMLLASVTSELLKKHPPER